MKKTFFIFTFLISNFIFSIPTFAQTTKTISACPYTFVKDLQYGESHKDVYILQQILNSDKRTIIASDGVGSPGMESNYFGKGTREALKRFQALFIEYIGIADGKFTGRTREMLQSICNGKSITPEVKTNNQNTSQAETQTTKLKTPLQIKLSLDTKSVPANSSFKVFLISNKEVKPVTPDIFIVDGGTVSEVRKLSKTEYFAMVTPEDGAKTINVQIEADKVEDTEGMRNENASNEITLIANNSATTTKSSILGGAVDSLQSNFDKILSGITASLPTTSSVLSTAQTPTNTAIPTSTTAPISGSSNGGSTNNSFSQMINGLLSGFGKQQAQQAAQQAAQNAGMDNGGWDQSQNPDANLADFEIPADINPACRLHYGIESGGSCPDVVHLTQLVKKTAMQACTILKGKKISSQSQYRSPSCNKRVGGAGASSHMSGMALDINVNNLSSTERQAVFMVFKKNGFNNIGCYRQGSGNVHLDHRGGGPRRWGPDYTKNSYNPANCPKELLQVFGS